MTIIRSSPRRIEESGTISVEILLIEDQRSLAQMAAKMLYDRWGCKVLIATTLAQVNTIIAQNNQRFFVAVSDLNLPDAHQGEVIDVLIAARVPVIAMTGQFDPVMHDRIMSLGVVDYVLKESINSYEYIVELVGRLYRNRHVKILVVDDSDTFCALLVGMLQVQGLQVLTASDGVAGLTLLEKHPDIKLVLVDYEMPRMNGFELLQQVRRKVAKDRLAVIGMAGSGEKRMSAQFLKLGANDFICKPFTYEELVCRVSQNLDMQESLEALRHVAYHDYLTDLLNRRAFFEIGNRQFAGRLKTGVVVMVDIDFFKNINDLYGHEGGDAVLVHFAVLLKEHFRQDVVARMGGEEFALLLHDADTAVAQCEAFRLRVAQLQVPFGDKAIRFTVSMGISKQASATLDELLKAADANLYKAKNGGRNRVVS